jgi:hypothetical protein
MHAKVHLPLPGIHVKQNHVAANIMITDVLRRIPHEFGDMESFTTSRTEVDYCMDMKFVYQECRYYLFLNPIPSARSLIFSAALVSYLVKTASLTSTTLINAYPS